MKLRRIRGQDAQRFGSTANLNIHLHCLVLDGVYHTSEDTTVFHPVRAPSPEQLQILLHQLIKCVMKLLTRRGYLIEEQDMVYMAETDTHAAMAPLHSAACTYRTSFDTRQILDFGFSIPDDFEIFRQQRA